MQLKCKDCGTKVDAATDVIERVQIGLPLHCLTCNRKTQFALISDGPTTKTPPSAELVVLEQHLEQQYDPDVHCPYPTGHENAVLGTRLTGEVLYVATCKSCKGVRDITEQEAQEGTLLCPACESIHKHTVEEIEVVQVILSTQRVLANLAEQFKDNENPWLDALEWYGHNMEGARIGLGNPIYINEVETN